MEEVNTSKFLRHQMTKLKPYTHEKHYKKINKWYNKYFGKNLHKSYLPIHGIVAEIEGEPVAACWLIQTDIPICYTDLWVCDPAANKKDRDQALESLILGLEVLAKGLGYASIACDIRIGKLRSRALNSGYKKMKETTMFKKVL